MAEGFAISKGGETVKAASAGSKPSGKVNEKAVEFMREVGVDLSRHRSTSAVEQPGPWDYVVTMGCGDACPVVPGKARIDWDIPDPKNLPPAEFRKVRDMIEAKVSELLKEIAGA